MQVAGELDLATAPQLRDGLQRILEVGTQNVVIDMAGVTFLDSSTLGVLVVMWKAFRDSGGRLCLAAIRPEARDIFALTSVDRAIGIYDTVDAAEASMPQVEG